MIQVIAIPIESDPAPFFANLFLAYKEAFGLSITCFHG